MRRGMQRKYKGGGQERESDQLWWEHARGEGQGCAEEKEKGKGKRKNGDAQCTTTTAHPTRSTRLRPSHSLDRDLLTKRRTEESPFLRVSRCDCAAVWRDAATVHTQPETDGDTGTRSHTHAHAHAHAREQSHKTERNIN